eukprot:g64500.t1
MWTASGVGKSTSPERPAKQCKAVETFPGLEDSKNSRGTVLPGELLTLSIYFYHEEENKKFLGAPEIMSSKGHWSKAAAEPIDRESVKCVKSLTSEWMKVEDFDSSAWDRAAN